MRIEKILVSLVVLALCLLFVAIAINDVASNITKQICIQQDFIVAGDTCGTVAYFANKSHVHRDVHFPQD